MMYFSVNDTLTGILGKRKSECSYQDSNLRTPKFQLDTETSGAQSWRLHCYLKEKHKVNTRKFTRKQSTQPQTLDSHVAD